jgi:D-alanyl-D-alanine dipeptidase
MRSVSRRVIVSGMTILLADTEVLAVSVQECGEPLVAIDSGRGAPVHVRSGVAHRLVRARSQLASRYRLVVVEGHRCAARQERLASEYLAYLERLHPELTEAELRRLVSRYVAPLDVAPHVAGAAVDITVTDAEGWEIDLGTPVDATPEESRCRCYFASKDISRRARANREMLACAMEGAGFVNYPTEWWHWSFGDRYWALMTGAKAAMYGPLGAGTR